MSRQARRVIAPTAIALEFLGDHVLGLIISDMLYRAYPRADEGELSNGSPISCARATPRQIARAAAISSSARSARGRARACAIRLGDICEAVIGAIYLDGGYAAASQFVERNWLERMRKPRRPLRDPKTVLQEWAEQGLPTPVYREIERTGPHHDPQFRVAVDLPDWRPPKVSAVPSAPPRRSRPVMIEREGVGGGSNDG